MGLGGMFNLSRGYPTLTADICLVLTEIAFETVRFVVTVRLLWPSDDTVAHSEGGKSSRTSGWAFAR